MSGVLRRIAVILVAGGAIVGGVALLLGRDAELPAGPVPIAWDDQACDECHMSVSDPRHAAQLQTADGRVLDFDDPGCLMRFVDKHHPRVHAIWFHALRADRWLRAADVGFVEARHTPMGYGLGAVARSTPGALSLADAEARVARMARADGRGPRPGRQP